MPSDRIIMIVRVLMTMLCIVFGAYRIYLPVVSEIHREDIFKDMAHLLVGAVGGIAVGCSMTWRTLRHLLSLMTDHYGRGWTAAAPVASTKDCFQELGGYFWFMFWAMVILEVFAFKLHQA